jgi:hypothetical protein
VGIGWSLPPVTLNFMRSRKPAGLRSLMIALLSALVFALLACEQTGSTATEQRRSTDQPTIGSESTIWETPQPSSESTRGVSETTGESEGNEPVPGGMLTVTFLDVGQGSSALIQLPNGRNFLIDGGHEMVDQRGWWISRGSVWNNSTPWSSPTLTRTTQGD